MSDLIFQLEKKYRDTYQNYRREIHRHPELSNFETQTSQNIADILDSLGLDVQRGFGGHGVVGLLKGNSEGMTVGLRADMDALPIEEKTGVSFASQNSGVMHACGHDVHMAVLLGVAMIFSEIKDVIKGNIKFIFQPAEENSPAGGAPEMIKGGVLSNPRVDYMVGLHVSPSLETGSLGINERVATAASDRIHILVKGKSAHAAMPDAGADAVVASAQIISALQTIVSRNVSPLDFAVVTIGKIKGGNRYNIIPDIVEMEGTVRTVDLATRSMMRKRLKRIISGVTEALNTSFDFEYFQGYPPVVNNSKLVGAVKKSIITTVGETNLIELSNPVLSGDDFAFYGKEVPSVFLWLGCRPSNVPVDKCPMLHSDCFLADEHSLSVGVRSLAQVTLDLLGGF